MVSRQIHRHISAVTPVARRRKFGVHTVHSNAPPTAAVLATQPFAPKPGRTQTRTLPATACSSLQQQGLSTSAGAATSGTGEDNTGGNSSKGSGDGSGRATRHEVGGAAVLSERKRRGAGVGGRPVDARVLPRAKQRVEVELGTFHEFTAVNKNGGKIFEASRTLIAAEDAVVFPAMDVSNLASAGSPAAAMEGVNFVSRVLAGRVTMVGLFHRQFGYSMLPSWTEPFEEAFEQPGQSERGVKAKTTAVTAPSTVSLSLLESWPLRMLKPLLVSTMGRGMSPEAKAAFFYRFGPTEEVRKALGISNRLTLYVLLVDQKGRVRWQGTGKSTPDEVESMIRCARELAGKSTNDTSSNGGGNGEAAARGGGQGGFSIKEAKQTGEEIRGIAT